MDFAVHIHQSGPFRTLPIYEPGLMSIKNNGRVTLVAQMVIWDISGEHLCKGNLTNQFFRLRADIPKGQSLMIDDFGSRPGRTHQRASFDN